MVNFFFGIFEIIILYHFIPKVYSLVKAIIIQFLYVKDANLFLDPVPQSAVQVSERVDEVKSATLTVHYHLQK